MTKLTKKSGDGTPEDSIPTWPRPADKVGGGRPPKEPADTIPNTSRHRKEAAEYKKIGETGFANDHERGQDPRRKPGEKLKRALKETKKAADELPSPHASEDKADQASGTLDAEGEGDRGGHRSGNTR